MEQIIKVVVQFGFAGTTGVLLWMVYSLTQKLLSVLEDNNRVISKNTDTIRRMEITLTTETSLLQDTHDKIISRPCIASKE